MVAMKVMRLEIPKTSTMQANASGVLVAAIKRGITAIARTEEADPFRIGNALRHRPIDRVDQVLMHPPAPSAVGGLDERLAEAGRAPAVAAHHGRAACGEP